MGSVEPMIINDVAGVSEFEAIPAVAVFRMRSYIGVPIVLSSGRVYGTLCALDRSPSANSERELGYLLILARLLASQLDRRELGIAEERNRLAREIHDTLAQSLSALVLDLSAHVGVLRSEAPQCADDALEMQRLARETLAEVRRSIWNLQPGTLEGRTLAEALSAELRHLERGGISATLEVRGTVSELPPPAETAVLRIAQEGLANAARHSRASIAVVTLEYRENDVMLRIDDDGQGLRDDIAPRTVEGGFGITSMRERARGAGGTFDLRARPGGGTTLECVIPRSGPATFRPAPEAAPAPAASAPPAARRSAAPGQRVRVGIVDDHTLVREGLRRLLESVTGFDVVCESSNGKDALVDIGRARPDVVLLDIQLPGTSGLQVLEKLSDVSPKSRAIMLTTFAQDEMVFQAVRLGARGYLLKETTSEEVQAAIRNVAAGGTLLTPAIAGRLVDRIHRHDELTPREREVLNLVGEGLRNREIAARLGTTEKTVQFHTANIFGKLGAQNRTEAVRIARARGLILAES